MTKKDIYNTYGAALSAEGLILYCYNKRDITIEEFVALEQMAFYKAMKKQWHLFKLYETFETDVELKVCIN